MSANLSDRADFISGDKEEMEGNSNAQSSGESVEEASNQALGSSSPQEIEEALSDKLTKAYTSWGVPINTLTIDKLYPEYVTIVEKRLDIRQSPNRSMLVPLLPSIELINDANSHHDAKRIKLDFKSIPDRRATLYKFVVNTQVPGQTIAEDLRRSGDGLSHLRKTLKQFEEYWRTITDPVKASRRPEYESTKHECSLKTQKLLHKIDVAVERKNEAVRNYESLVEREEKTKQ